MGHRPSIDVMDETFIVTEPAALAERLRDPELWRTWWPRLTLTVTRDRGRQGVHWSVRGDLAGTAEIWLEPWRDGVVVHWMLRAEPVPGGRSAARMPGRRVLERIRRTYVTSFKHRIHALKDELEAGRAVGAPRRG